MDILEMEKIYCSQGDTSGKHQPKKVFSGQEGCFLFDVDNIPYLDMQMFNSAANFGYKNNAYNECFEKSSQNLLCLSGEFINKEKVYLSKKISNYMQTNHGCMGRVHFTVGGAQAVDDALKLAFKYTKKNRVFAFEGGYHGRTMAASSISASYRYTKAFGNVIDTHRIPFPNCYRCAYGKNEKNCSLYCIEQFERLFESEFNGITDANYLNTSISAFIFEPVLGRGGYVFPNKKYLKELERILHKHNILIIADEVQMGFYRTGRQWSFEHYGITPDIIIFGKAITNGLWPLAGVWARDNIISPFNWSTGSTHCTFANSPLAMLLGIKTIEITQNSNFVELQNKSAKEFGTLISKLKAEFSFIGRAQVEGHAAGLEIIDSITQKIDGKKTKQLIETALNETVLYQGKKFGLILTAGGIHDGSIMLSPSINITSNELELFYNLLRANFEKVFLQEKN